MAGETTVLDLPYPQGGDAPSIEDAVKPLADRLEEILVPVGLASGQGLVWNGTDWVPESFVKNSLVDAKGDVLVGTAADTPARLPVGTNGKVLVAASGETTGLKWEAVAPWTVVGTYSATWDPASINYEQLATQTLTVTGAAKGDMVLASHSECINMHVFGQVYAANSVVVYISNETGGAVDVASGTLKVVVLRFTF